MVQFKLGLFNRPIFTLVTVYLVVGAVLLFLWIHHVLFPNPPEMTSRHRNDSSQMKDLLHFDDTWDKQDEKENGSKSKNEEENKAEQKREEERDNYKHKKHQDNSGRSSDQASGSTSMVPYGAGASGSASVRRRQSEGNDLWREDDTLVCALRDLKRLPECDIKLGDLQFSKTNVILIDVRFSPLTFSLCTTKYIYSFNISIYSAAMEDVLRSYQMCFQCQ